MTVVNPKSISGINSITMASGGDDLLTIHSNNTTERVRVNNSGDVIIGSGVTLSPDGDIFATGVCTATSFSGDGSNLTGISAGTALSGSTDNTVTTVTGANAIQGESNLTFDGSDLTITNSGASNKGLKMTATGNYYPSIVFDANRGAENNAIVYIRGSWNGTEVGALSVEAGDDTTNKDDGKVTFYTAQGGTMTRKMAIEQDGDVHIDTGNVVIGTSGKGIDFSATSDASGSSSELLDDYEEGVHTVTVTCTSSGTITLDTSHNKLAYHKIGNWINVHGRVRVTSTSSPSGQQLRLSLPYQSASEYSGDASRIYGVAAIELADENSNNYGIQATYAGQSFVQVGNINTNTTNPADVCSQVNSNSLISINVTYRTV